MIFWLRNKKNNLLTILLVIAFLVSFCSSAFSSSFKIGFPAPTFTLKTIDGETFNLEDYKEKQKLLILYFCNISVISWLLKKKGSPRKIKKRVMVAMMEPATLRPGINSDNRKIV